MSQEFMRRALEVSKMRFLNVNPTRRLAAC